MTQGGAIETGIFWPAWWALSGVASGSGCDWRQFTGVVW